MIFRTLGHIVSSLVPASVRPSGCVDGVGPHFLFQESLHEHDEAVLPWGCHLDLCDMLWVRPILDLDHGASLLSGLELETTVTSI